MAECACGGDGIKRLLYACSGAANTGLLADNVARRLGKLGAGDMTCLAAIGAELSGFVESAKEQVLARLKQLAKVLRASSQETL